MTPDSDNMRIGRSIEPIVGFSKLPEMTEKPVRPTAIKGKILQMAAEPPADRGTQGRMAAFKKTAAKAGPRRLPEQKLIATKGETTEEEPGYVRLRLLVKDGEVSVLNAKSVEGPLVEDKLQGALAYEVMLGKNRVAAGAIPDVGEKRSFPAPKARGEQAGHFVTPLETYEINVRVPKERVSAKSLSRLEVALYRVKEELPIEHVHELREIPLGIQFERHVREVGRLKGLQPEKQTKPIAAQLRKAFA